MDLDLLGASSCKSKPLYERGECEACYVIHEQLLAGRKMSFDMVGTANSLMME